MKNLMNLTLPLNEKTFMEKNMSDISCTFYAINPKLLPDFKITFCKKMRLNALPHAACRGIKRKFLYINMMICKFLPRLQ
jgi:hypothetical protein